MSCIFVRDKIILIKKKKSMYYLGQIKVSETDAKGKVKEKKELYLYQCEFFQEIENKLMELTNNEAPVVALKQTDYREFINEKRDDDDVIYKIKLVSILTNEDGSEKLVPYIVGAFAHDVQEATHLATEYITGSIGDLVLEGVNKTKIIEILK